MKSQKHTITHEPTTAYTPLKDWAAALPPEVTTQPVDPHTARHWARTGRITLPGGRGQPTRPGAVKVGRDWLVLPGAVLGEPGKSGRPTGG